MKRISIFVALALIISAAVVQAQTQKGSLLLGGTAGFSSSKVDDVNLTTFLIDPKAGYFVIDKLCLGAEVTFLTSKYEDYSSNQFGLGPFARYYLNGSGNGRFFVQAAFSWSSSKSGDLDAVSATGIGGGVGLDYFLNDHVAIETVLGYDNVKTENADKGIGTFGLNIGIASFISGKQSKN